jgi:hypothetical protein
MDDDNHDKNLVEKTIEAVKDLATSVTDAAKHAMDTKPDTGRVAETANEQVNMPTVPNATAMPLPLFAAPAMKKRKAPVKPAPAKVPPKKAPKRTAKAAAKKPAKKAAKKTAKKSAKKSKAKSAVKKTTAKKAAKKKKAKKSRR